MSIRIQQIARDVEEPHKRHLQRQDVAPKRPTGRIAVNLNHVGRGKPTVALNRPEVSDLFRILGFLAIYWAIVAVASAIWIFRDPILAWWGQ